MAFMRRWFIATMGAFLLFPIVFVLWNGSDADFGLVGGMIQMVFIQFISPYNLWTVPLVFGTAVALGWHVAASRAVAPVAD